MRSKINRIILPKIKNLLTFILLCGVIVMFLIVIKSYFNFTISSGLSFTTIVKLIVDDGAQLKSTAGKTNLLILGIGGANHEGGDLTDTMMVLSINRIKNTIALISLPRDVWSDTLKDKINSAYHYGEEKKTGGGLTLAKVITEDIIGFPIQYSIVFDFSGFKKIIDLVGGVDINVKTAFTDSEYPITGRENDLCGGDPLFKCRYQEVHFNAGLQHFDGDRALIYVRSRHSQGLEGTDFARGDRQQEILLALKQKLVNPKQIFRFKQNIALFHELDNTSDMDLTIGELLTIGKSIIKTKFTNIQKISIEEDFTVPPENDYDGRYVLVPKENFQEINRNLQIKLDSFP
jgi:polyisoprenyl-teichoic acid--peptidoglycan teichoic acid transferase